MRQCGAAVPKLNENYATKRSGFGARATSDRLVLSGNSFNRQRALLRQLPPLRPRKKRRRSVIESVCRTRSAKTGFASKTRTLIASMLRAGINVLIAE